MVIKFNRMELSGSLGDLGTLLPIGIGMIVINGIDPLGMFLTLGLYYIVSGLYFGVTVPVQPMKVIGAYSIAMGIACPQIVASAFWVFLILLLIGATGAINLISRYTPKSVVRGVQLSTGLLLLAEGVRFMAGTSKFQVLQQAAEPYLSVQALGFIPIGLIIGAAGAALTLFYLENRKFPAGLLVICFGLLVGLVLSKPGLLGEVIPGFFLPRIFPTGVPARIDYTLALIVLVLPQIPMTLGNAVIANADLSEQYFGADSRKVTYRALCLSMSLANLAVFFLGGMPLCHGAGGLAAHYRFGARTAGSNVIIGLIFILLAVFFGPQAMSLLKLLPISILGVLLIFAGSQLAMTVLDIDRRKDLFVVVLMVGITLVANLAVGFVIGFVLAYALKSERLTV